MLHWIHWKKQSRSYRETQISQILHLGRMNLKNSWDWNQCKREKSRKKLREDLQWLMVAILWTQWVHSSKNKPQWVAKVNLEWVVEWEECHNKDRCHLVVQCNQEDKVCHLAEVLDPRARICNNLSANNPKEDLVVTQVTYLETMDRYKTHWVEESHFEEEDIYLISIIFH